MPYVALPPETRASREAFAKRRWTAFRLSRPDLEPAVALQEQLVSHIIALADGIEHGQLPRLALPARYLAAKLRKLVPALSGEPIPLPTPVLLPTLLQLCDVLAHGGAGEAASHIRDAIAGGSLEAGSLLSASLARDQQAIRTGAVHRGLAPDLVWLIAELAVSPFAHALQQALLHPSGQAEPEPPLREALEAWTQGYCPICGSWPALAESRGGQRVLRCSFCALAWSLRMTACAYCGETGGSFTVSTPDPSHPERQLEACGMCRSYLKAVDVDAAAPFPLLAITDLETLDVDMTAMQSGYHRPALKAFGHR